MASITIDTISNSNVSFSNSNSGEIRVLVMNADGTKSSLPLSALIDTLDDDIVNKVEEQVLETVDVKIDQRLEDFEGDVQSWQSTTNEDIDYVFN